MNVRVHVESEKDCELAVEVSGWRSERTREPRQGCEYKARDEEKRKKRRFDFRVWGMLGRLLGYVGMPRLACGAAVRWYVGMLLLVNLSPCIPYPPTARGPAGTSYNFYVVVRSKIHLPHFL